MQAESVIIKFVVYGEPASKANSRRLVHFRRRPMFIKSQKALDYSGAFKLQAANVCKNMFLKDVVVSIKIYYQSRRPDLDESLILDLMQGIVYKNDRQVKEKHVYWGLDKECPRTEISVQEIG
jgi:Holliday junction resolvase RusA-like endonuclease